MLKVDLYVLKRVLTTNSPERYPSAAKLLPAATGVGREISCVPLVTLDDNTGWPSIHTSTRSIAPISVSSRFTGALPRTRNRNSRVSDLSMISVLMHQS